MIRQSIHNELSKRLREKRRFIQVLAGPRQVGKTTLARQVMAGLKMPSHYASADEPTLRDRAWLEQQWDIARLKAKEGKAGALLIVDEVQKVSDWPNAVKLLWDADTHAGVALKVVLLGSSPLLIQSGLTESLAGRFEVIAAPHARDVLLLTRVDKPALLRRLFHLGCAYSGQILSYQKMIGQLTDAGNTTTLAHYLELLEGAGMLAGLPKHSTGAVRQRASSPKLQVLNTALMSAQNHRSLAQARQDGDYWGRLVESCVGAHLFNSSFGKNTGVAYWRERNHEVDFVLQKGKTTVALEVKSGRRRESLPGMEAFARQFKPKRQLLVGGQGIPLEEFLLQPVEHWLS